MDNVDHEGDSVHSDPRTDDMTTSTSGGKRKRDEPTKRGIVTMNKVIEARHRGIKIKVDFDRDGQPIGRNKSTFADYIGYVARTKVPLTENDWRSVPHTLRQAIWEDIQQTFVVEDWNMDMTLRKVGKAAREFRSMMAKMCFDDEGNPMLYPPEKYATFPIVRDHWMDFVNACGHRNFKELSATNSQIAKNKKFLYRKGALGYAQLRENMKDELEKEPPARQRWIVWKESRVDKNGNIIEEEVKSLVNEGDSIAETLTYEDMMNRGPEDLLAKTLAKSSVKEYHGRVLTAGSCVTKKQYFGKRREESSNAELHQMKQVMIEMQKKIAKLEAKSDASREDDDLEKTPVPDPPIGRSEKGSCQDANQIPEGESLCDLYVDSPTYTKVGWGLVYKEEGQKVHNVLLKSNEVKVCVKEVCVGRERTLLPIQNVAADIYTVEEAKGTFVVWPLSLVVIQNKVSIVQSNKDKSGAQSITPYAKKRPAYPRPDDVDSTSCRRMCSFYCKTSNCKTIPVQMSDAFWNTAFTDHVGIENIQEVLNLGWLSATSISVYIRYLCDALLVHEEGGIQSSSTKYSFTSPQVTKGHTHIVDALQKHADQDHLVIIPYHLQHHWLLVAINAQTEYVYYMDSLRVHHTNKERAKLEFTIKSALSAYRANKQGNSGGRSKTITHVQWYDIQCPKQDLERGYCAYYICLFIEDILESGATNVPAAYFQKRRCNTFSDDRIEHVQKEWTLNDLSLKGTLTAELGKLIHVKSLILHNNSFYGSIPADIGSLQKLEVLDLGCNNFCEPVPTDLESIFSLELLTLEENRLLSDMSLEHSKLSLLSQIQADEEILSSSRRYISS